MRYVAERNPGVGKLLHKGLKYYKDSKWSVIFKFIKNIKCSNLHVFSLFDL